MAATGINARRLLRIYVQQRARLQLERERSARSIARTTGLVRVIGDRAISIRVLEQDCDGHRVIEVDGRSMSNQEAA